MVVHIWHNNRGPSTYLATKNNCPEQKKVPLDPRSNGWSARCVHRSTTHRNRLIVKGSPQSSRSSWRMAPLGGLEFRSLDVQHIQTSLDVQHIQTNRIARVQWRFKRSLNVWLCRFKRHDCQCEKTVHDEIQRLDRCVVNNIQSCHKQRLDRCIANDSVSCQTHSDWIATLHAFSSLARKQ